MKVNFLMKTLGLVMIQIRNNKLIYQDKPRLKTALVMLRTSMRVEESLSKASRCWICFHLRHSFNNSSACDDTFSKCLANWVVELTGDAAILGAAWRLRYSDRP